MATTAEKVRELRDKTGAGVMDCKEALAASGEDLDRAVDFLRKKGLAAASKRSHREARDGVVGSYVHAGSKLGVLIEVNCETDFVARTEQFQELVKGLAMQVAAASPRWVSREEVPADVLDREREIYREQMADQKKPPRSSRRSSRASSPSSTRTRASSTSPSSVTPAASCASAISSPR